MKVFDKIKNSVAGKISPENGHVEKVISAAKKTDERVKQIIDRFERATLNGSKEDMYCTLINKKDGGNHAT